MKTKTLKLGQDEITRIWLALRTYRDYQDFVKPYGEGSIAKTRITKLANKIEKVMYAEED